MNTYMVDSGNVTRKLLDPWAIDSGGVARKLKKIWVIDSTNVARLVFTSNIFTLSPGASGGTNGYVQGAFGSIAPSNILTDTNVIEELTSGTITHTMILVINQGASGPSISSSYLTSLTINGTVWTGASASFSGGGSSGQWNWSPGNYLGAGPYTLEFAIT